MQKSFYFCLSLLILLFLMPQDVLAATDVYYSVGQSNSTDLKTGSPTVTIASGLATFSMPQTGNIGVGDKINFGSGPATDVYISGKINQSEWTVVTVSGTLPADVSSQTVNNIYRVFSSLSQAEDQADDLVGNADLTVADRVVNISCYYDTGADTTAVAIDGYTTDATRYIKIFTPSDTATEANQTQRHNGVWSDAKYRLSVTSDANALNINDLNVKVVGLQVSIGSYDHYAIWLQRNDIHVDKTIARVIDTAQVAVIATPLNSAIITNSLIYGATRYGLISNGGTMMYLRNLTLARNVRDGMWVSGGNTSATNIASVYNGDGVNYFDFRAAGGTLTCNNCASVDGTADDFGGTGNRASVTPTFVDEPGRNYHLAPTDDDLRNFGSDLGSYFTDDIDGQSRSGLNWDIGADEATFNGPFTVQAWVKPDAAPASKAIMAKAEELRMATDGSGKPLCQIKSGFTWQTAAVSSDALSVNQWSHVACSYDQSNLKIYVNGVEKGSQALTVGVDNMTSNWKIGTDDSSDGTYGEWEGLVDDFQFYDYARVPEQIVEDLNAGHPSGGSPVGSPLTDYNFDEGSSGDAHNRGSGGSGFNGSLNSGSGGSNTSASQMWSLDGYFGKAVELDGTDDRVSLPDVGY